MPFRMYYIPSKRCFTVRSAIKRKDGTRKVYAKCTTKEKAQRQIGLLRTIVFNYEKTRRNEKNKIKNKKEQAKKKQTKKRQTNKQTNKQTKINK